MKPREVPKGVRLGLPVTALYNVMKSQNETRAADKAEYEIALKEAEKTIASVALAAFRLRQHQSDAPENIQGALSALERSLADNGVEIMDYAGQKVTEDIAERVDIEGWEAGTAPCDIVSETFTPEILWKGRLLHSAQVFCQRANPESEEGEELAKLEEVEEAVETSQELPKSGEVEQAVQLSETSQKLPKSGEAEQAVQPSETSQELPKSGEAEQAVQPSETSQELPKSGEVEQVAQLSETSHELPKSGEVEKAAQLSEISQELQKFCEVEQSVETSQESVKLEEADEPSETPQNPSNNQQPGKPSAASENQPKSPQPPKPSSVGSQVPRTSAVSRLLLRLKDFFKWEGNQQKNRDESQ